MEKNLQTIIEEALEQKNLTYEKLATLTGISEKYIISLQSQELNRLPAYPYIRGYLKKICEVLDLNFEESWNIYQKELSHKTSGAFDKLPTNRFALQKINQKNVAIGVVSAILLVFLALNFNNFFGKPYLEITCPKDSLSTVSNSSIKLAGKINPADKLTINDKDVVTGPNGNFESVYELQLGLNSIEFKVKKILGKKNSQIKQIIFEIPYTEIPAF